MGGIIVACLTALYVLLFLFFIIGLARTHRYRGPKATPSVSVVVPMRNEEEFAQRTLEALAEQDYAGEWEVICVDDRSTDSTKEILEKFAATHPRFRVLSLPQDLPVIASPKKRALESAFKIAKNEVLLTMDADCIPRKSWITAMAGRFVDGICIVQGPKQNNGSRTMPHLYQKLETLGYTAMEAAGFSWGHPIVASAACLAYKKELFFEVGGFGDLINLSSGDDDMLIHKMMKIPGTKVCYNLDKDAVIETAPVHTWKQLFNLVRGIPGLSVAMVRIQHRPENRRGFRVPDDSVLETAFQAQDARLLAGRDYPDSDDRVRRARRHYRHVPVEIAARAHSTASSPFVIFPSSWCSKLALIISPICLPGFNPRSRSILPVR